MDGVSIKQLFTDKKAILEIQEKLPKIFAIAAIESSRAGKMGMEVGSLRERVLIALLIYKFGEWKVKTDIPITEPEIDVLLEGNPISIKTITGSGGIKAVWTVDPESSMRFIQSYKPKCDILLAKIHSKRGGLYLIPLEVQNEIFSDVGRENYLKMPKPNTNPRGVEFEKVVINRMTSHPKSFYIPIDWSCNQPHYDVYERWILLWTGEEESE